MNHQYIEVVGDSSNFNNLNGLNDNKTDVVLYDEYYNGYFSLFMWILGVALCFNLCKAIKTHNVYVDYQRQQLNQNNQNSQSNNNMPDLPNYTIIQNKIIKIKEYTFNNELKSEDSDESCSICLENYKKNDTINILKCGHKYHEKCIDEWISTSDNCPLCRLSI